MDLLGINMKNKLGSLVKDQWTEISKDHGLKCEAKYIVGSELHECFYFCCAFQGKTRCAVNRVLVPPGLKIKEVKN